MCSNNMLQATCKQLKVSLQHQLLQTISSQISQPKIAKVKELLQVCMMCPKNVILLQNLGACTDFKHEHKLTENKSTKYRITSVAPNNHGDFSIKPWETVGEWGFVPDTKKMYGEEQSEKKITLPNFPQNGGQNPND